MGTDVEAARQGLMKFIAKKGGSIPMRDLHTHSLIFYQAGHQAFSQLMDGLVIDEYVTFDDAAGVFQLSDKGRAFLESKVPCRKTNRSISFATTHEYVTFDDAAGVFQLSDKGRAFLESS